MKKFLVVKMDVTDLTEDEVAALEFEMVVQGETSDEYVPGETGHPNAPFVSAEVIEVAGDEVTAKLADMLSTPAIASAVGIQAETRTGRGPNGKLRNFRQMKDEKLRGVRDDVMNEGNDEEAIEAVLAECEQRGI